MKVAFYKLFASQVGNVSHIRTQNYLTRLSFYKKKRDTQRRKLCQVASYKSLSPEKWAPFAKGAFLDKLPPQSEIDDASPDELHHKSVQRHRGFVHSANSIRYNYLRPGASPTGGVARVGTLPLLKTAGVESHRNLDTSIYVFLQTYLFFAFSNIFKTKWPKSEEKLKFRGRLVWVPITPTPQ